MRIVIELDEHRINEMVSEKIADALLSKMNDEARRAQVSAIMGPVIDRFREAATAAARDARLGDGRTVEEYIAALLSASPSTGTYDQRNRIQRVIDASVAKYADGLFEELAKPYLEKIRTEFLRRIDEALK